MNNRHSLEDISLGTVFLVGGAVLMLNAYYEIEAGYSSHDTLNVTGTVQILAGVFQMGCGTSIIGLLANHLYTTEIKPWYLLWQQNKSRQQSKILLNDAERLEDIFNNLLDDKKMQLVEKRFATQNGKEFSLLYTCPITHSLIAERLAVCVKDINNQIVKEYYEKIDFEAYLGTQINEFKSPLTRRPIVRNSNGELMIINEKEEHLLYLLQLNRVLTDLLEEEVRIDIAPLRS
jgi:hypothetical protein